MEFAIVLLVKHRQDWKNQADNSGLDEFKIKDTIENDQDAVVGKVAGKVRTTQGSKITLNAADDEFGRQTSCCCLTICNEFHTLPLTTKIDFSSFLLYNICYFLVNLIYWLYYTFN